MVLPPPAADAGALAAQAQLAELIEQLERAKRGVLFALTDGTPTSLGWVVHALSSGATPWAAEAGQVLEVCLHGPELVQVPKGSRVLVCVREHELAWLNLHRPIFADLELRAVLWAPSHDYDQLVRKAVDLASWVLQDLPLPAKALPDFAIAGVHAAITANVEFAWRGPGLDECLAAIGWEAGCIELSAELPLAELIARLSASGLPVVRDVDDEGRAWRVRMAMAMAGRSGAWVARDPAGPLAGMPSLHAEQEDWEHASERLRAAGWRRAAWMAAWLELEPECVREACEVGERALPDAGEFGVEAIVRGEVPTRVWRLRVADADVVDARARWDGGESVQAQLWRALRAVGREVGDEAVIAAADAAGLVEVAIELALRRFGAGAATDLRRLAEWLEARGEVERALPVAEAYLASVGEERERGWALDWLGGLHRALGHGELALRYFDDALAIRKQLVEREPGRSDLLRDLSVSFERLGDLHRDLGHGELALRYFDDSLAIRKQLVEREPGRSDLLRDLSVSFERLGDLHRALGHGELALRYFEQDLAIAKQLVEREPGRSDLLRDLSVSFINLGDLHRALGHGELALRYFDDSLAIRRQLVEREPGRSDLLRDLSVSFERLGDLHHALGHGELALRYFDDSLAIAKQLVEREPGRSDLLRGLSFSFINLGDLHRDLGHGELALRYFDDSLAIAKQLVEREPGRSDLLRDLSFSFINLGDLHRDLGHGELALRYFDDSLAIRKQLVEREPGRSDLLRDLAISFQRMVRVEPDAAPKWLQQSLDVLRRVCAQDPTNALTRRDLGLVLALFGEATESREALREAHEILAALREAGALDARYHARVNELAERLAQP